MENGDARTLLRAALPLLPLALLMHARALLLSHPPRRHGDSFSVVSAPHSGAGLAQFRERFKGATIVPGRHVHAEMGAGSRSKSNDCKEHRPQRAPRPHANERCAKSTSCRHERVAGGSGDVELVFTADTTLPAGSRLVVSAAAAADGGD